MVEFIDHEFVCAHELWTYPILHPIGLYNVDGSPNEIGKITEAIDLVVVRVTLRRGHSYMKILRDRGEPNRCDTLTQW